MTSDRLKISDKSFYYKKMNKLVTFLDDMEGSRFIKDFEDDRKWNNQRRGWYETS